LSQFNLVTSAVKLLPPLAGQRLLLAVHLLQDQQGGLQRGRLDGVEEGGDNGLVDVGVGQILTAGL
jgi:hypothetical protein